MTSPENVADEAVVEILDWMMCQGLMKHRSPEGDSERLRGIILRALQSSTPSRQEEDGRRPDGHGLSSSFQDRSAAWMGVAFAGDPTDGPERRDRTAEEDCEAYQADGGTLEDWIAIGRYTFGRPAGALPKEIGQKVFTLACWAAFRGIDMVAEAERELARCSTPEFIEKLARKRATRHGRGPLPGFSGPETSAPGIAPSPVVAATTGGEAPGRDDGWRSMDSAPRDGSWFEAWVPRRTEDEADLAAAGVHTLRWSGKGFWWTAWTAVSVTEKTPAAWRPLSAPRPSQREG